MVRGSRSYRSVWGITALLLLVILMLPLKSILSLPSQVRLLPGQSYSLELGRWLTAADVDEESWQLDAGRETLGLLSEELGELVLELRLLGLVPVRNVRVQVVPEVHVVPGGQAIGVLLNSHGLMVARTTSLIDADGRERHPAREAGIQPGDVLAELGGERLSNPRQVTEIVERFGREGRVLPLVIIRDGQRVETALHPVRVIQEESGRRGERYLIGLFLEDPTAGVGTLTFYHPESGRFGALGHMITDPYSRPVEVNEGRIVEAQIKGIQPGLRGLPGEKIGVFEDSQGLIGSVDKNTGFGVYGSLTDVPRHRLHLESVPVALAHEVQTGPVDLLTVVRGERVERFTAEITAVHPHRRADGRGLVLRITDPALLRETQGIVQGMSGSPLIQNGRLVGAVTHVFVNDPTRGYGVMAEWMVYEAGILPHAAMLPVPPPVPERQPRPIPYPLPGARPADGHVSLGEIVV